MDGVTLAESLLYRDYEETQRMIRLCAPSENCQPCTKGEVCVHRKLLEGHKANESNCLAENLSSRLFCPSPPDEPAAPPAEVQYPSREATNRDTFDVRNLHANPNPLIRATSPRRDCDLHQCHLSLGKITSDNSSCKTDILNHQRAYSMTQKLPVLCHAGVLSSVNLAERSNVYGVSQQSATCGAVRANSNDEMQIPMFCYHPEIARQKEMESHQQCIFPHKTTNLFQCTSEGMHGDTLTDDTRHSSEQSGDRELLAAFELTKTANPEGEEQKTEGLGGVTSRFLPFPDGLKQLGSQRHANAVCEIRESQKLDLNINTRKETQHSNFPSEHQNCELFSTDQLGFALNSLGQLRGQTMKNPTPREIKTLKENEQNLAKSSKTCSELHETMVDAQDRPCINFVQKLQTQFRRLCEQRRLLDKEFKEMKMKFCSSLPRDSVQFVNTTEGNVLSNRDSHYHLSEFVNRLEKLRSVSLPAHVHKVLRCWETNIQQFDAERNELGAVFTWPDCTKVTVLRDQRTCAGLIVRSPTINVQCFSILPHTYMMG
ncbi:unnamed protein product [Calicophoron daubneyi]|uniref:Uncharacterized protein n=1 Tax=Calicophoron daubneyi TaxID=300641 RepID=A0AAV2TQ72_CALDB